MKKIIAVACVAFTLGLSGSPASADDVPGAWLIVFSDNKEVFHPSKLAMSSMKQCVISLRGKGKTYKAIGFTDLIFYADGSEIPDWEKLDNKILRDWAKRADHVAIAYRSSFLFFECIRAK